MKNSVPGRNICPQSYPALAPQSYSLHLQPLSQTHHLPAPDRETQSVKHSVPSTIGAHRTKGWSISDGTWRVNNTQEGQQMAVHDKESQGGIFRGDGKEKTDGCVGGQN